MGRFPAGPKLFRAIPGEIRAIPTPALLIGLVALASLVLGASLLSVFLFLFQGSSNPFSTAQESGISAIGILLGTLLMVTIVTNQPVSRFLAALYIPGVSILGASLYDFHPIAMSICVVLGICVLYGIFFGEDVCKYYRVLLGKESPNEYRPVTFNPKTWGSISNWITLTSELILVLIALGILVALPFVDRLALLYPKCAALNATCANARLNYD